VIRVGHLCFSVLMRIGGDEYVYRSASQTLSGPQGAMQIPLTDGRLTLRVLVDRTTVEVFGDRGQAYAIFIRSNPGGSAPLELRTVWGEMQLEKLSAHSLRSSWTV
jgi:hypothetical protein